MKTRMMSSQFLVSVLTVAGLACGAAHAVTLSVPTQFTSVQAAIDAAVDGDEILVAPGTYAETLRVDGKRLTIRGTGASADDVRLGGPGGPTILKVFGSTGLRLENLALRGSVGGPESICGSGGLTIFAGALLSDSSIVEIDRCVIADNTGEVGGAIFLAGGTLTIRNTTIEGNGVNAPPGGTRSVGAVLRTCDRSVPPTIIIEDSILRDNGDVSGGLPVLSPFNATMTVRRTRFENNRGACIAPIGFTALTIEDSIFAGNVGTSAPVTVVASDPGAQVAVTRSVFQGNAGDIAAGVYMALPLGQSTLRVIDSDFINSQGTAIGAFLETGAALTVDRCEIRGGEGAGVALVGGGSSSVIANTLIVGVQGEGILINAPSEATDDRVINCTIVDNANLGIRTDAFLTGTLTVRNSIIRGNVQQIGLPLIPIGQTIDVARSNIQGGFAGLANTTIDPQFESPTGVTGDYRLRATSPAIDAGDAAALPTGVDVFDLANNPRRVDIASVADTGPGPAPVVDLGAYERPAAAAPTCPADFNNAGGVTVQDIFDFLGAWFASDARADFNNAGGITVQDIFDFLTAWFAPGPNC